MKQESKQEIYDRISEEIHSDTSPVGIDAKKTHILILAKLEEMQSEIRALNEKIDLLQKK